MTDQLLRYAEFAGIPIEKSLLIAQQKELKYPLIIDSGVGLMTYFNRDENGKAFNIDWTLSTYLGRLVIADAIMQSEKWPKDWLLDPREGIWIDDYNPEDVEMVMPISEGQTWADAVLAAVDGVS